MGFSVGLGLTNDCDLACAHCYRPRGQIHNLTLGDVKLICESVAVDSVGLGTGENGLNPEFFAIIDYFTTRRIPVTLASNGYTVQNTPDEILKSFREVEFSIDFPTAEEQDAFRGQGNWQRILSSVERCKGLGLEVSVLAVLMNMNYNKLGRLAQGAAALGCNLRVNVFQPVQDRCFLPSYEQFWEAFRILFDAAALISCTEPLVNTFAGLNTLSGSPCGRKSIRITPLKQVLPCVYWPRGWIELARLARLQDKVWETACFQEARKIPEACTACLHVDNCRGGCRSRAVLLDRDEEPDLYCPIEQGDVVRLHPSLHVGMKLLRARSICTTIVRG
jgi:radical SAM protein with 4Fe4S-binding SPASM domain